MSIEQAVITGVLFFLIVALSIAMSLIAHFHLPTIERYLQRSLGFVELSATMKHGGVFGKSAMCGILSLVFLSPKIFAKRGFVSVEDINFLPRKLKIKISVVWYSAYLVFIVFVIFGYWMGWG